MPTLANYNLGARELGCICINHGQLGLYLILLMVPFTILYYGYFLTFLGI